MHAVIIVPPYTILGNYPVRPTKAMLPTGPLSIGQELRNRDVTVTVIDLVFSPSWQKPLAHLAPPDILLIACHTARNIDATKRILEHLRQQWKKYPFPYTVLGGNVCLELGTRDFQALGLNISAVVRGYGSGVVERIYQKTTGDLWPKGRIRITPPALDLLCEATHAAYRKTSESTYPIVGHGFGCAWKCSYCVAHMDSNWQLRDATDIEGEAHLAQSYAYQRLWCVDNLIFTDPKQSLEFDALAAHSNLTWSGMTRAEVATRYAEQIGQTTALTNLAIGVESADLQTLIQVERKQVASPATAFQMLREISPQLELTAFVILDWPRGNLDDFWRLYRLLEQCQPTSVSWSFYNPPARALLENRQSHEFGFYGWPFGTSRLSRVQAVQTAMLLTGRWWKQWRPERDPFFVNGREFGVHFHEGTILQKHHARAATGDLWQAWKREEVV